MTVPTATLPEAAAVPDGIVLRRRERRRAVDDLFRALSRSVEHRTGADLMPMRETFEEWVRRIVRVRSIHVRETGPQWAARSDAAPGPESIALDIPVASGAPPALLEATFDPACRLGEWDFQFLSTASHIASIVLDLDRCRTTLARLTFGAVPKTARDGAAPLIGSTMVMQQLRATIERVAGTDFTVLLEGESGVGKELVARQIHELSRRRRGPFIAINCAALVETLLEAELFGIEERTATGVRGRRGKFEHADGGTLFLDEVSDLSLSAQAKLLRAIQDLAVERVGGQGARRVDIRIIAATNRSLADLVQRKLFRPDLFYRLSGVDVRVPTLRERRPDVLELSRYFLERHRSARRLALSAEAADALLTYNWPGNVRELERLIERAITMTERDVIALDDLPPQVRGDYADVLLPALERNDTMRAWGSRYARLVLGRSDGNKREACRVLGISYHTLQSYLRYPAGEAAPIGQLPAAAGDGLDEDG